MSKFKIITLALCILGFTATAVPVADAQTRSTDRIMVNVNGQTSLSGTVAGVSGSTLTVKSWDKTFSVITTSATKFTPTIINSTFTPAQRLAAYKVGDIVMVTGVMSSSTYAITPTYVMNSTEMLFGSSVYSVRKFLSGTLTEIGSGQVKLQDSITSSVFTVKTDAATILYDSLGRKVTNFTGWKSGDSAYAYALLSGGNTGTATYIKNRTYTAPAPTTGVCGSSNRGTFTSAPTTNLCSVGTPTTVTGTGPWSWQCKSPDYGSSAYCYAYKQTTDAPTAPTATFYASPTSITSGQTSKLTWTSSGASSCTLSPSSSSIGTSGSVNVTPTVTTTYTLKCVNSAGTSVTKTATVTIGTSVAAPTASFGASPSSITSGQTSTLTWVTTGATSCTLSPSSSSIGTSGSVNVTPTVTTTYTLKCVNSAGTSVTKTATVSVGTVSTAVNGVCGSANGVTTPFEPTTSTLCSKGTATTVSLVSSNWTWQCKGLNGGTTASCSAPMPSGPGTPVGP